MAKPEGVLRHPYRLMSEVTVHVGGHVTLLFSVHSEALLARNQGSRGAGICLEDGVSATVKEIPGESDRISVTSMNGTSLANGEEYYSDLLKAFREVFGVNTAVDLEVDLELPVSQGFGMSAAGLMAASFALGELFDTGDEGQLARLAHRLERTYSRGLGDVLGIWAGGVELRIKPGTPPSPGKVLGFEANVPVLLVWNPDGGKHTAGYIDNPVWQASITQAGDSAVNRLMQIPWNTDAWPHLLNEADNFADNSGLRGEIERSALLDIVKAHTTTDVSTHLCMLGTSAIVVPRKLSHPVDLTELADTLREKGLGIRITWIH